MTSRERVLAVIQHRKPDRIPIYGWVSANLDKPIAAAFGSVAAFEDRYEFDYAHLFGGPACFSGDALEKLRKDLNRPVEPADFLAIPYGDPNDRTGYSGLIEAVKVAAVTLVPAAARSMPSSRASRPRRRPRGSTRRRCGAFLPARGSIRRS